METWDYSLGYYLWGCKQYLGANLVSLIANGKSIREMDGGEKKLKRKKKTKDIVGKGKGLKKEQHKVENPKGTLALVTPYCWVSILLSGEWVHPLTIFFVEIALSKENLHLVGLPVPHELSYKLFIPSLHLSS